MLTNGKRSARIGNAVGTAGVAQLVEQLICNQQVGGSSPSTSSTILSISGGIPERSNGADCKSVVTDFGGSNPPSPTNSEIPAAVPFPASPKTALWREFLRLQPRTALLGPRLSFFTGDGGRGDTGRRNYKKLGGEFKIAHMFDYVKGDFTRFL